MVPTDSDWRRIYTHWNYPITQLTVQAGNPNDNTNYPDSVKPVDWWNLTNYNHTNITGVQSAALQPSAGNKWFYFKFNQYLLLTHLQHICYVNTLDKVSYYVEYKNPLGTWSNIFNCINMPGSSYGDNVTFIRYPVNDVPQQYTGAGNDVGSTYGHYTLKYTGLPSNPSMDFTDPTSRSGTFTDGGTWSYTRQNYFAKEFRIKINITVGGGGSAGWNAGYALNMKAIIKN